MQNLFGCTATVLYKLYKENQVEITKEIATLMLSAIVSDTLLFQSPTCTEEDKKIATELEKISGLNVKTFGLELLKAGTDLSDFSAQDLITLDAKEFDFSGIKTVIAQINTASIPDVMKNKANLELAINQYIQEHHLDLFFFAITDIIESNSQIIALGKKAELVEKAYQIKLEDHTALLEGVVSRKKQIVPQLSNHTSV